MQISISLVLYMTIYAEFHTSDMTSLTLSSLEQVLLQPFARWEAHIILTTERAGEGEGGRREGRRERAHHSARRR